MCMTVCEQMKTNIVLTWKSFTNIPRNVSFDVSFLLCLGWPHVMSNIISAVVYVSVGLN